MSKPKIRFKGYCNDWERRKLGEIITEYKETVDSDCTLPILTSSKTEGVILQEEHFGRKQQHDITGYNILPRNYCTYRNRSDGVDFTFNINKCCDKGIISKFYPVFSGNNSDVFFLSLVLNNSEEVVHEIAYTCTGTGQKVLSFLDLQKMRVRVPSFEEQKKVGEIITTLDHLITLHQRQCENTKKLKKFMLQKMFPKKNQKNPEIRFAGFTNDWERSKFSNYYKMSSGYAFKMSDYCDDGIGLINGESIQHGTINDNNLNYLPKTFIQQYPDFVLKEGDIVVGLNRPVTNGNLKIARIPSKYDDSLLYQRAGKIVYRVKSDKNFSYVLLSQEILKYTLVEAVGSDQPFISTSKLDKWEMMLPIDIAEQHKIGEYFSSLDHLITLHQNKCDELKKLKKFMLQNMFI